MRIGLNPNPLKTVSGYPPVVVSAITYLPNQEGYHEHRMEVIQTSLQTMRDNAGTDCAVWVWDNGSCEALRDWLLHEYKPEYLTLSPNIGKSSARASIVRSLPDETIIGVADDDMYYSPDWLRACINVMLTYPNVGQVSGYPVRTQMRWANASTIRWARDNAKVEVGRFIPDKWDYDFAFSVGRDYNYHLQQTINDSDLRITYRGMSVYAAGHHCQWVGKAGIMKPFCVWDDEAMADEKPFDYAVDKAGYLRLTTEDRYTRHIGNYLDEEFKA